MRNATLTNKSGDRLDWGFIVKDDITPLLDAIEDSKSGNDFVANVNNCDVWDKFSIDRETSEYVRLKTTDCWGNVRYLKAYK